MDVYVDAQRRIDGGKIWADKYVRCAALAGNFGLCGIFLIKNVFFCWRQTYEGKWTAIMQIYKIFITVGGNMAMKKQAMMASLAALALLVSPLGSMCGLTQVSAEEQPGADVSVQAEEHEGELSETISIGELKNVQFSEDLGWCMFEFPAQEFGVYKAHIWVYRDDQLFKEYETSGGGNSIPWNINIEKGQNNGSYVSAQTPFYQDLTESGAYRFEMRIEKDTPQTHYESEKAVSPTVQYTRPEQALGTTTGYWDTKTEGLFHFTSVEGAAGYEFRLYRQDGGQWIPCYIFDREGRDTYASIGHLSIFSRITTESTGDIGGEDRTVDFAEDIYSDLLPSKKEGSYCVTVRALSGNLKEIANGEQGEMSEVFRLVNSLYPDSDQTNPTTPAATPASAPSLLETLIGAAQPGDVIHMQDVNTLASNEVRQLLNRGLTLEMEYTYEGIDYKVRIPAGASMDDSISWYGPLYLAQHYGVDNAQVQNADTAAYMVKKGDTLSRIASTNGMTLGELAAKNPQIKNLNRIVPGQIINIK